jgi:hypothetical protein
MQRILDLRRKKNENHDKIKLLEMNEFIAMLYFETHNFSFFLLINDIVIIWLSSQIYLTTNYM